jgi:large subunit ribosomal protein L30
MSQSKMVKEPTAGPNLLLAVRIRGTVGDNPRTELALKSLGMEGKFNARLVPGRPDMMGMLRRAKDIVTWGELEHETLEMILSKRAEKSGPGPHRLDEEFARLHFKTQDLGDLAKKIVAGEVDLQSLWRAGVKPTIRLHPPKGGFRKSTKRPYKSSGELGYRGREINRLAKRMI